MKSAAWFKALKTCADPRRARHFLELLSATEARLALQKASPEQTRILTALLSGSNALGTLLVAHPGWLAGLTPDALKFPRSKQGLRSEAADWLQKPLGARDYASALARVREFKQRQMLRIAARDLARLVREQWSIEAHHHVRDVTFGEGAAASRTGSGPANLATIRAAVIAAIKDAGYLHIPEGRRDHTTPAETLRLHGLD